MLFLDTLSGGRMDWCYSCWHLWGNTTTKKDSCSDTKDRTFHMFNNILKTCFYVCMFSFQICKNINRTHKKYNIFTIYQDEYDKIIVDTEQCCTCSWSIAWSGGTSCGSWQSTMQFLCVSVHFHAHVHGAPPWGLFCSTHQSSLWSSRGIRWPSCKCPACSDGHSRRPSWPRLQGTCGCLTEWRAARQNPPDADQRK